MQALYAWPRRHPRLLDGGLALGLLFLGGAMAVRPHAGWPLHVVWVIAIVAPVMFRRRHPTGAFVAAAAAGALQVALGRPVGSDVAILVLLYTLAAYRPRRISVPGLGVCLIGAVVAIARWAPGRVIRSPLSAGEVFLFFAVPTVLAWVLGDSTRYRRGYYRALEERAARLERERDAQAQIAAAAERARIAREMHDVIAHNVSVMVVQADGAAFALDAQPERARGGAGGHLADRRAGPDRDATAARRAAHRGRPGRARPAARHPARSVSCSNRRERRGCRCRSP